MSNPSDRTDPLARVHGSPSQLEDSATLPPAVPAEGETLPPAAPVASDGETLPPAPSPGTAMPAGTPTGAPATQAGPSGEAAVPGYEILGELGRGGMGVVYKARQTALDRTVALKMILSGGHAGAADLERFRTEAEAIARVQHPHIVQVFEVGRHGGLPFFSLEFCPGGSLEQKLSGQPLPPSEAATLVEKLRGMQAAHDQGVIHRDLKPANVLLTADGTPRITDFGLAKKLDAQGATVTGAVMGTPSYMAPEQAGGRTKEMGRACDIYALGAILYECLTTRPPFQAATPLDTILQVVSQEPVPPSQLNGRVPRDLETICLKCLHKEPSRRYASAAALADDLGRFQRGEPIVARPVGSFERGVKWVRRHAVVSALAFAVLLVLLAGVAVSSYFAFTAYEQGRAAQRESQRAEAQMLRAEAAEGLCAEEQLYRAEWFVYASKLSLAQSAFAEGNGGLALQHLNECQWNLRGWEHHHLWTRFSSKQTFVGHTSPVVSVAYSPDGKRIVTGSGGTAKVWDAETGQELLTLKGHSRGVWSVAFSPDGKRILTGGERHLAEPVEVKLWDAQTGREILTLKEHTLEYLSVAFSPDGKRFVTGGNPTVWDTETGREVLRFKTGRVKAVAFSPDGKRILTGGHESGEVKVWDADTGQQLLSFEGHKSFVFGVAWSPDGKRILTGSWDKSAKVWDAENGQELATLKGHTGYVSSVAWSPDGKRILTGSYDKTARVWDAEKGQEVVSPKGHTVAVFAVAFSPDGSRILTGSDTARVWNAEKDQGPVILKGDTAEVSRMVFSPDGTRILTLREHNREVKVWDTENGKELLTLRGHKISVDSAAFSPDSQRILTGSRDSTAKVWDAQNGQELLTLEGHTSGVRSVSWSPDGQRILTGSGDRTAKAWNAQNGQESLALKGHIGDVSSVAFSPDGKRILTVSGTEVKVWDADKAREVFTLKHSSGVLSVSFSPDGKRIASGSGNWSSGEVNVWDTDKGREVLNFKGHTGAVRSVAFSPDGKRILTGGGDSSMPGEAKIWDAGTGQELLALKGHVAQVISVAFSAHGKRILTGSKDGMAMRWEAERRQDSLTLKGHTLDVRSVAFSPDSKRVFAWNYQNQVLAWSTMDGKPVDPTVRPPQPQGRTARSADGFLHAEVQGHVVAVRDTRLPPNDNTWPLPDRDERLRYHGEQARFAEQEKQWFAAAFHLGRMLLDQPDDADLKRRRDDALKRHAANAAPVLQPGR